MVTLDLKARQELCESKRTPDKLVWAHSFMPYFLTRVEKQFSRQVNMVSYFISNCGTTVRAFLQSSFQEGGKAKFENQFSMSNINLIAVSQRKRERSYQKITY